MDLDFDLDAVDYPPDVWWLCQRSGMWCWGRAHPECQGSRLPNTVTFDGNDTYYGYCEYPRTTDAD